MVKTTTPASGARPGPQPRGPAAGRGQARPAVSPALLATLAGRLTARDRWLLRMLLEHRVLTTTQVCDLAYGGPRRAALRLSELYRLRAVDRFRPLAAAGSSTRSLCRRSNAHSSAADGAGARSDALKAVRV